MFECFLLEFLACESGLSSGSYVIPIIIMLIEKVSSVTLRITALCMAVLIALRE